MISQTFDKLSRELDSFGKDDNGDLGDIATVATLGTVIVVGGLACAYVGSYVGEGLGWAFGHMIDWMPLARNVAPNMAERVGLLNDPLTRGDITRLNVDLYQFAGAKAGFWGGAFLPLKLMFSYYNED